MRDLCARTFTYLKNVGREKSWKNFEGIEFGSDWFSKLDLDELARIAPKWGCDLKGAKFGMTIPLSSVQDLRRTSTRLASSLS